MTTIHTWNILADIWLDEREYKPVPLNFLDINTRYLKIRDIIDAIDSDVVLLQEVTESVYTQLRSDYELLYLVEFTPHLPNHWLDQIAKHKQFEPNGNVIMLKHEIYDVAYPQSILLSKNGNVAGIVEYINDGDRFLICNIHLDDSDSEMQVKQSKTLLRYLSKLKKTHKIIIGGDFNADRDNGVHDLYLDAGFHSSLLKQQNTSTYYCEDINIDHIYSISGDFTNYVIYNLPQKPHKVCKTNTIQLYGSDHYPLVADLIW